MTARAEQTPGAPIGQRIDGRVVLVTGAPRRPRARHGPRLAAAGAKVAVHHLGQAAAAGELVAELRAGGAQALPVEADVRDWDAVGRMVDAIEAGLGPLDGLL
jgi:3-oxoacyl-[acyl-carrier protein] reductase